MSELVKVFVYGTLKKGFANHYLIQNGTSGVAQFVTTGHTKEAFPLVVGTDAFIPFMLPVKNQGKVTILKKIQHLILTFYMEISEYYHPTGYKSLVVWGDLINNVVK